MKKMYSFLVVILFINIGFAQEGEVKFKATISNRNGDVIFIKDNMNKTVKEIKSNEKGVFNDSFIVKDGFYVMYDGVEYAQLYLKSGYNLKLTMDAKKFDQSIVFVGKGADENNFLAQNTIHNEMFQTENFGKDHDDFYKVFEEKKKVDFEKLEKLNFDANFKVQEKKNMTQEFLGMQMEYKGAEAAKKVNGKPAPQFDYVNFDGTKTKLSDLKGKYVYIDVWATWCGPCRAEIPFLQKVEEKYHGKNIAFVSISVDVDKDFEKWKSFVADKKLGGIQLFADKNWNSDFITAFGINAIPRFILIDGNGNIIEANAARPSEPVLQEQLDKLLK